MTAPQMAVTRIIELVETYTIDAEQGALEEALTVLGGAQVEASELMERLDKVQGDSDRKARAIIAIRSKLGLSLVPGPVCRPRRLH